jgi:two-component system response regulator GlrR
MEPVECKVIAAPAHERWMQAWAARDCPGVHLRPCCAGAPAVAGEGACDVTLMLVGRDTLAWARQQLLAWHGMPVVAVTRDLSGTMIQGLLALGVCDFLASERSGAELKTRLWRLREQRRARTPAAVPGAADETPDPLLTRLIGANEAFVRQRARIPLMAASEAGVLILGETGTGKELCAQAIHYLSRRRAAPFVAVNCGALPAELVEAELFGHARGAYTSAHAQRGGLIAEAEGGTFFLDEVDSMPASAQVKLLRFLQEREYRPVGSTRAQRADVRVVAATNADIDVLAAQGRFRRDLYYRLNILSVTLPPLRERLDDLALLAQHFIHRHAAQAGCAPATLTGAALAKLAGHAWPGNVRELEHALERAVLLCASDTIGADDLELPVASGESTLFCDAKARAVQTFERDYIERMLLACQGNITHAAQASGKDRRAFWELIRKHGIDAARFRA